MVLRMHVVAMDADNDAYFNLGTYRRHVTTSSDQAQLWFNRGLIWSYGFNHEEGESFMLQAASIPCKEA